LKTIFVKSCKGPGIFKIHRGRIAHVVLQIVHYITIFKFLVSNLIPIGEQQKLSKVHYQERDGNVTFRVWWQRNRVPSEDVMLLVESHATSKKISHPLKPNDENELYSHVELFLEKGFYNLTLNNVSRRIQVINILTNQGYIVAEHTYKYDILHFNL
jgi:hypothetical protein